MLQDQIKHLSGDAARLLLALLTCDGAETLADLPTLIERAGLAQPERNTHGKTRSARTYRRLNRSEGYHLSAWKETGGA